MNILISTTPFEDYLSDMLLHGFRSLFGEQVVDYPKKECMYTSFSPEVPLYGRGFSLYRTLSDISIDRDDIDRKIRTNYFDLIIVSDIQRQSLFYRKYADYLTPNNSVVCDGEDNQSIFPYKSTFLYDYWNTKIPHKNILYFKREWTPKTIRSLYFKLIPTTLCRYMPAPKTLRTISFAIPEEKIVKELPEKIKRFPEHIVDTEIAQHIGKSTKYAFATESEYYDDLRKSKFGITVKRAGWDCMRHYEIAANAADAPSRKAPSSHEARGPNQLWCWDITYLPSEIRGLYFYLYLVLDVYSRKIVGWEVHGTESGEHAAELLRRSALPPRQNSCRLDSSVT